MNISLLILIVVIIGFIFSGILLLKQSAKKFNLSDEQLKKIKQREASLQKEEESEKD